jgi:tripartite-type tricarboxylate transporter receptor subunit TctC
MRYARTLLGAAIGLALISGGASAQQDYPNKPIHVVIGFAAGSGADILVRYYTTKLGEISKQQVLVENKPGAIGTIAGGIVARARPDGYTILFTGNSMMAAGQHLVKELPFDADKDFVPAAGLFDTPFVLVVGAKSPVKSVPELIAHLKAKQARYGYTNPTAVVATAYFLNQTGTKAEGVGYRLSPDALPEVENATLDFMIFDGAFALGQINGGRLRALAATPDKRISVLPSVPTMQEAGVANYNFNPWWGAYLPAGTPQPIVDKVATWVTQITTSRETAEFLEKSVAGPVPGDAKYIRDRLAKDKETWTQLVKLTDLKPQ